MASSVDCLLYAWFNIDLIVKFFPDVVTTAADGTISTAMSMWTKVMYSLFGVAGVWIVVTNLFKCKCCKAPQA